MQIPVFINFERDEILNSLPKRDASFDPGKTIPCDAWVYVDQNGRLNILLKEGGWLGVSPEGFCHIQADIAPFHG